MTLTFAVKHPSMLAVLLVMAALAQGASPAAAHSSTSYAFGFSLPLIFPPPVVYGPPAVYAPPPVVYTPPPVVYGPPAVYSAPAIPVYAAPPQYYPGEWPGLDIFTRR
jgi:hypothetical protein